MLLKQQLTAKDLVTVGIYSTLYSLIGLVVALVGFIPIFIPLLAILIPLAEGVPFMLFVSKAKKFGMITLMGFISGIIMLITGMGYWTMLTGLIFGALGDAIIHSGKYQSRIKNIIGYAVFSISGFGNFMPFFINRDTFFILMAQDYGNEYATTLRTYMPFWIMPILPVASFISGIIGGYIGVRICKKHFERAGIA